MFVFCSFFAAYAYLLAFFTAKPESHVFRLIMHFIRHFIDIRELQLVKGQGKDGKYRYTSGNYDNRPISDRFVKIFRETTLSYACAQNLIVVKTLPGCAGAAGEAIDTLSLEHMVGSVCGDNTMLVIVDKEENVPYITAEFDRILNSND